MQPESLATPNQPLRWLNMSPGSKQSFNHWWSQLLGRFCSSWWCRPCCKTRICVARTAVSWLYPLCCVLLNRLLSWEVFSSCGQVKICAVSSQRHSILHPNAVGTWSNFLLHLSLLSPCAIRGIAQTNHISRLQHRQLFFRVIMPPFLFHL